MKGGARGGSTTGCYTMSLGSSKVQNKLEQPRVIRGRIQEGSTAGHYACGKLQFETTAEWWNECPKANITEATTQRDL